MNYRPITDVWILARRKHDYYGGYPAGYVQRARDLLGVTIFDAVLHVCAGKVRDYPFRGVGPNDRTVDIDPKLKPRYADYVMDVRHCLPRRRRGWPSMMVDTPYSEEEAANYAAGRDVYPQPQQLLRDCLSGVRPGGRVGILHYVWTRHPKALGGVPVRCVAKISVTPGQGNADRCYAVYERMDDRKA